MRLTTDAPLVLYRARSAVRADAAGRIWCSAPTSRSRATLATTCREFCDRTRDYWQEWVRRLAISYEWQDAVIRAAITLKLCSFRGDRRDHRGAHHLDPRSAGLGPQLGLSLSAGCATPISWCSALNRIGATRTMEDFISYILEHRRPADADDAAAGLRHRADRSARGAHRAASEGYRGDGPVRIGNAAVAQDQHDTYGSVDPGGDADVLRPAPAAAGRRSAVPPARAARRAGGRARARARRRHLGISAAASACTRIRPRCAGPAASGSAAIAAHLGLADRAALLGRASPTTSATRCCEQAWNPKRKAFTGGVRRRRSRRQRAAAARTRR